MDDLPDNVWFISGSTTTRHTTFPEKIKVIPENEELENGLF